MFSIEEMQFDCQINDMEEEIGLITELLIHTGNSTFSANKNAHDLAKRYGSISAIIQSCRSDGRHPVLSNHQSKTFRFLAQIIDLALRRPLETRPNFSNTASVVDYLYWKTAHLKREHLSALFLTRGLHLICCETISIGSIASVDICNRAIIRRALEVEAGAIILTHNHPSGQPLASPQDLRATHRLEQLCAEFEIILVDHIIIAESGHVSLVDRGHLRNI